MSEQEKKNRLFSSLHLSRERYFFLQIADLLGTPARPDSLVASTGWNIIDYNNALSASPGVACFGRQAYSDSPQLGISLDFGLGGESAETENFFEETTFREGTVVRQAWVTAQEMLALAMDRGWKCLSIVDSDPFMARSVWVTAKYLFGIKVYDFFPSEADQVILSKLEKEPVLWKNLPQLPKKNAS